MSAAETKKEERNNPCRTSVPLRLSSATASKQSLSDICATTPLVRHSFQTILVGHLCHYASRPPQLPNNPCRTSVPLRLSSATASKQSLSDICATTPLVRHSSQTILVGHLCHYASRPPQLPNNPCRTSVPLRLSSATASKQSLSDICATTPLVRHSFQTILVGHLCHYASRPPQLPNNPCRTSVPLRLSSATASKQATRFACSSNNTNDDLWQR